MKILILGCGLMGPAAAFQAMANPAVEQVILCDVNENQLRRAATTLAGRAGANKVGVVRLDLTNQPAAVDLLSKFDGAVAALPDEASVLAIKAALQAGVPLVDLAMLPDEVLPELRALAQTTGGLVVLGGGLEPGLTEIMARHLAEQLDQVDELHIQCGGIPETPAPPLGYKIVFGGRQLPLHQNDAQVVENGQLKPVPRYSGVEPTTFAGVGSCEAYQEGFMPWLLDIPALQNLQAGTQKTVRWPGYAAKVTVLKEMGLLNETPVQVDGLEVVPKKLLDTLLYPYVKLEEGERDIVVFRVDIKGVKNGNRQHLRADMVDRFDAATGFTAMARTTAFTGAIIAQMMAAGDIGGSGLYHPEQLISGSRFEQLLLSLANVNINFEITHR